MTVMTAMTAMGVARVAAPARAAPAPVPIGVVLPWLGLFALVTLAFLLLAGYLLWDRARLRRRLAAAEGEGKYRSIFENALDGMFRIAPEGRILDANPAMARILGYEDVAQLTREITDVGAQIYVRAERRAEIMAELAESGRLAGVESLARRRDGSHIWISEHLREVRDESGALLFYEGHLEDATERKRAEAALRHAKEQADLASRSKSEFLANMSHELRTPLNAIIGFAEIMENEIFGPAGASEYVDYATDIHDSGTHLLELINDILDMSKIESGKRELNESMVDVVRVVMSCLRLVRPRADQAGIEMKTDFAANMPLIRAEERALKQVVLNLLTNAVKFTEAGGRVTVEARLEVDGRMLLAVGDSGIGIAEDEMATALAPFGQIESTLARHQQGTGLGLPLVQSLVRLHDGEFAIDSAPGEGTRVSVWLPAARIVQQNVA